MVGTLLPRRYGPGLSEVFASGETVETLRSYVTAHSSTGLLASLLLMLVLVVYLPGVTRDGVQANDSRAAAVAAYLYVETGSFAFPDSWPKEHAYWVVDRADGRLSVNRMPGVIASGIPAYAIARFFNLTPRLQDVTHPVFVPYAPAGYSATVITALAILMLFVVFTRLVSDLAAFGAALVFAFTTPMWSVSADALWPHATTALTLLVLLWAGEKHGWIAAGAAGVLVVTRPHLAIVPVVLGLGSWRNRRQMLWLATGTTVGIVVLVTYSQTVFGTWLPAAGYDTSGFLARLVSATPYETAENVVQALLNRDRGVLLQTPYVAVLLPAIWLALPHAPSWTKRAALAGAAYFLLQMRMTRFSGGSGFAQWRTSLETLVLLAPIGLYAIKTVVMRSRAYVWVLCLSVVVAFGMSVYGVIDGGRSERAYLWWAEQLKEHASR